LWDRSLNEFPATCCNPRRRTEIFGGQLDPQRRCKDENRVRSAVATTVGKRRLIEVVLDTCCSTVSLYGSEAPVSTLMLLSLMMMAVSWSVACHWENTNRFRHAVDDLRTQGDVEPRTVNVEPSTASEVYEFICSLKHHRAFGPDDLPPASFRDGDEMRRRPAKPRCSNSPRRKPCRSGICRLHPSHLEKEEKAQLKRQARLRREFIYRRSIEARDVESQRKKDLLRTALKEGKRLPKELENNALDLNEELDWSDEGGDGVAAAEDDEYLWAGTEDPRVVVTTSRSPSSRLKEFAKELRFLVPNATKINRGNYQNKDLLEACLAKQITDLIVVNETRGVPDTLTISHLPFGPTAVFTLYNVHARHEMEAIGRGSGAKMPQAYPHHIFHGLNSKLGMRVRSILKHLFPVPKDDSRRVITWYEEDDVILFRHHTYKYVDKELQVQEHGPSFDMRLYKIWRGPLHEEAAADVEWVYRPYMSTTFKRRFLSE
ncbi:U3 small nucleolar ribonucleoprotein protein IMP4, partial [Clonorchis sinensis]